jgi:pSer/pThr/pTyr-binding forkhead associated (FHA) protein
MPVPLTLKIFKGTLLVGTKEFSRDIIKIGRLSSAHLSLDDEKISRIHSVIQVSADGQVSILDMGSAEGTFVNGKRVSKGALQSGDEITLGGTRLVLELGAASAAATPPTPVPATDGNAAIAIRPAPAPSLASSPPVSESQAYPQAVPTEALVAPAVAQAYEQDDPTQYVENRRGQAGPIADVKLSHRGRGANAAAGESTEDGVEVRVFWAETLLGSSLRIRPPQVLLGTGGKADFIVPGEYLPENEFAVVKTSKSGEVSFRFMKGMEGEFQPAGQSPTRLSDLVARGQVTTDDGAYALTLPSGSLAWASLGSLTVEVELTPAPKRVIAPFWDGIDYRFVNLALLMGFAMLAFIISAATYPLDTDTTADDLFRNPQRMMKFVVKPPEKIKNPFAEKLKADAKSREKGATGEKAAKKEGQAGTKSPKKDGKMASKDTAKDVVMKSALFKALGANGQLAGMGGVGGGLNALGHLVGSQVGEAGGLGSLGLRGTGEGGGGFTGNIGLGDIGTKGKGLGYGLGVNLTGKKSGSDIGITSGNPQVEGSMDKELIRRVIHEHRAQVRYCYESELQRHPGLNGKVTVKFVIGPAGAVQKSGIDNSTLGNASVENCIVARVYQWQFPKPKGGGVVQVSYPFLLKESGD